MQVLARVQGPVQVPAPVLAKARALEWAPAQGLAPGALATVQAKGTGLAQKVLQGRHSPAVPRRKGKRRQRNGVCSRSASSLKI